MNLVISCYFISVNLISHVIGMISNVVSLSFTEYLNDLQVSIEKGNIIDGSSEMFFNRPLTSLKAKYSNSVSGIIIPCCIYTFYTPCSFFILLSSILIENYYKYINSYVNSFLISFSLIHIFDIFKSS